jgi:Polyketide cyclase / dehydrase and lipid transport
MSSLGSKHPVTGKASTLINRAPSDIFRYLGDGFFENYPKWSPEVIELAMITDGPLGLGTVGRQVRVDQGHRSETQFKIDIYEPGKRLGFVGISDPFRGVYELRSLDSGKSSELTFTFELTELQIFMLPFAKLIRVVVQEGAERTVRNLKRLIEAPKQPMS